jgi:hypothetical protein
VNLRSRESAALEGRAIAVEPPGAMLEAREIVKGQTISGNDDWCDLGGSYCWSGGVKQLTVESLPVMRLHSPGFSARAVAAAEAEWRYFGEQTHDEHDRVVKAGHKEDAAALYWDRVRTYWVDGTNTRGLDGRNTDSPWSAAFISWLMRKAGAGHRFRYSTRHAVYISQAIRDSQQQRAEAGYWCYPLDQQKPEVGDLVCFTREDGVTYDQQKGGDYKSHCDLVVEVTDGAASIIGGNIGNSVTLRTLPLNADGYLAPRERLFGLMKCRIG